VLDPDVVLRSDAAAVRLGGPSELHGADQVARMFAGRATAARVALIDGAIGAIVAPNGKLLLVLTATVEDGRITEISAIADRAILQGYELTALS
jgi:RNA polymerase sigma-70 factor (ECF subfamily)